MDVLEKEIMKYEKKGLKIIQKRTLKYGLRVFLKKKFGFFEGGSLGGGFLGVYIYYVDGDATTNSLRECLKDYEKFYEAEEFGEGDKGFFLCSGRTDDELFKDLRKAMIRDDNTRNSIRLLNLGETTERETEEDKPRRGIEKASAESSEILSRIKKFTIHKMPKTEKDLDSMLVHYLSAFYPDICTQVAYQNTKIDAQIGDVGIEIKYQPSSGELDRLYGQTEKYLKHLEKVIVVIGYEKSRELTETFEKRIKERGWLNNRVFIVSIR
jgi:hypothetical protein